MRFITQGRPPQKPTPRAAPGGLHHLHIQQHLLHRAAVATELLGPPRDDAPILPQRCEGAGGSLGPVSPRRVTTRGRSGGPKDRVMSRLEKDVHLEKTVKKRFLGRFLVFSSSLVVRVFQCVRSLVHPGAFDSLTPRLVRK